MGLEGGFLSRHVVIMATNDDTRPPSGSTGAGGRPFVPVSADYDDACPLAPISGAGGRPFVPVSADYDDAWPSSGSHYGGWRAAFCPRYAAIMATYIRIATLKQRIKETNTCCPKSCEPSQRRWIRSRKRLNTAQARASAGAVFGGSSASGGTDLASSAAFSMNSSRRTDRTTPAHDPPSANFHSSGYCVTNMQPGKFARCAFSSSIS